IHTITTEAITKNKKINVKNGVSITSSTIISVSGSLPSQLTDEYNLRQQEFKNPQYNLLLKQLIVYAVMICGLFGTLIFHYMTQTKKLKREIEQSRKEAISAIEEAFPDLKGQKKLSAAIDNAKAEIVREQKTWFAYSNKSRALFLQTLLELTSRIHNAKNIDFTLEQLTISDGILTLKARVKDHPQLISLENELNKSELFSYIEPQENPQFTMKII